MTRRAFITLLATLFIGLLPPALARAEGPVVFAAASLSGALERAVAGVEPAPRISYGGSGAMAQQVARGAPADLVILASPDWMAWLTQQGHVQSSVPLLSNTLVVVAQDSAPLGTPIAQALASRLNGGRLAIGQRRAVPAGAYAQAWLEAIGAWNGLEPHLAEAANVRAALAFVAQGAAPVGIVYASDGRAEPAVHIIHHIAPDLHPPILYPAAALTEKGAALLQHLRVHPAAFTAAGFTVLP